MFAQSDVSSQNQSSIRLGFWEDAFEPIPILVLCLDFVLVLVRPDIQGQGRRTLEQLEAHHSVEQVDQRSLP